MARSDARAELRELQRVAEDFATEHGFDMSERSNHTLFFFYRDGKPVFFASCVGGILGDIIATPEEWKRDLEYNLEEAKRNGRL